MPFKVYREPHRADPHAVWCGEEKNLPLPDWEARSVIHVLTKLGTSTGLDENAPLHTILYSLLKREK